MESTKNKRVTFSDICVKDGIIEGRFTCHHFTPNSADQLWLYSHSNGLIISVDDCPIVDSETGERSARFSVAQLAKSTDMVRSYKLHYMGHIKTGGYICFGPSKPILVLREDNVIRLKNKCSDSEENSSNNRSQQELMSKTNEVKDLIKRCAELEQQVKGYDAENRRLLDELSRSKERVEELELKSREEVLESREKTADKQVLISTLDSIWSVVEAQPQHSSASKAKVLSERRDIDSENKLLSNELEDMKAQCDSLQAKTQLMMTEIMDFDKIKLKNKVQIKTLSEELKELKNGLEEMVRQKKELSDEWKEREQSMANEWRKKECLFETQLSEMTSRLASASDENQKLLEQNTRIEAKIDEIKHNYFEIKSQTNGATNDSVIECDEVKAGEERLIPVSEFIKKRDEEMMKITPKNPKSLERFGVRN